MTIDVDYGKIFIIGTNEGKVMALFLRTKYEIRSFLFILLKENAFRKYGKFIMLPSMIIFEMF